MIEANNPEINIDELMEKIREEVRRRKEGGGMPPRTVPHTSDVPHTSASLTKISPVGEPEPFRTKEDGYHINDFLKYHDEQFIINAYRGILRRGPDSAGHDHFLNSLRSGKMTKAVILGRLRYSPEGRAAKVKVSGLLSNFIIQSSYAIPILGYLSRLGTGILNLPRILRNIQTLEESTFTLTQQHSNELISALSKFGPVVERKADREELGSIRTDLETVLERKADREELGSIRTDLETVLERKADRDALGTLKDEFQPVLDRKADNEQIAHINNQILDILRQTRDHKLNILDQKRRLKILLEEARKRLPEPLAADQISKMVGEESHLWDALYASFEDQFRGTREDIKERLKVHLPYIRDAGAGTNDSPVIDVGCGRGEWLELLQEEGLNARGVDMNRLLVGLCQSRGMDVTEGDAVDFLKQLSDNSVGAVTGFHLLEHLPLDTMLLLFSEALRVLRPGGIVILETPNPENVLVGSCTFYSDPTHKKPIPPDTLSFLVGYQGFVEPEILRLHPLNYLIGERDDRLRDLVYRFNMGQDYAVIARKAS